jgi:hypothetical protein
MFEPEPKDYLFGTVFAEVLAEADVERSDPRFSKVYPLI